jgi:hypothetical protein
MTRLALLPILCLAGAAVADGPRAEPSEPAAATDPGPLLRAPRPGDRALFRLSDGGTLLGTFVERGPDGDVVELASGARIRLAPGRLVGVEQGEEDAGRPDEVRVYTTDGRVIRGRLLSESPLVRVRQADGTEVTVARSDVRELSRSSDGLALFSAGPDPAPQRYAFAPSAFLLGRGSLQVALRSTGPSAIEYGVAPWLSVALTSVLPYHAGDATPANAGLQATAGYALGERLRVAAGVRATHLAEGAQLVSAFATATVGSPDLNATLHLGPPPIPTIDGDRLEEPAGAIAVAVRPARRLTLLAEQWLGRGRDGTLGARTALGARLAWRGVAADVGLASAWRDAPTLWFAVSWTLEVRP